MLEEKNINETTKNKSQDEKTNLPVLANITKNADELVNESLERIKKIEEDLENEIKIYNEIVSDFEKLKDEVISESLVVCENLLNEIEPKTFTPEIVEDNKEPDEKKEYSLPKKELKPEEKKRIETPSKGFFSKLLFFILGFGGTFLSLLLYAKIRSGIKIDSYESFINSLDLIALSIGKNLAAYESTQILMGKIILFGLPVLVGVIFWYIKKYFINKKNLSKAKMIYNEVLQYEVEKREEIDRLKNLTDKLKNLFNHLKTLQVFLDEMNAKVKRIIHLEGKNRENFTEKSKQDLEDTQKIKEMIIVIENVKIEDNLDEILENISNFIESHKNRLYS